MKTFNKRAGFVGAIFLVAIFFMVANPVSAANASDNTNAEDTTGSVAGISSGGQSSVEQNLTDPPVIESHPGPGCYRKKQQKHGTITYKYKWFEHTHPDSSEWELVPSIPPEGCKQYGK